MYLCTVFVISVCLCVAGAGGIRAKLMMSNRALDGYRGSEGTKSRTAFTSTDKRSSTVQLHDNHRSHLDSKTSAIFRIGKVRSLEISYEYVPPILKDLRRPVM